MYNSWQLCCIVWVCRELHQSCLQAKFKSALRSPRMYFLVWFPSSWRLLLELAPNSLASWVVGTGALLHLRSQPAPILLCIISPLGHHLCYCICSWSQPFPSSGSPRDHLTGPSSVSIILGLHLIPPGCCPAAQPLNPTRNAAAEGFMNGWKELIPVTLCLTSRQFIPSLRLQVGYELHSKLLKNWCGLGLLCLGPGLWAFAWVERRQGQEKCSGGQ